VEGAAGVLRVAMLRVAMLRAVGEAARRAESLAPLEYALQRLRLP
jgi:hypothetical protein